MSADFERELAEHEAGLERLALGCFKLGLCIGGMVGLALGILGAWAILG